MIFAFSSLLLLSAVGCAAPSSVEDGARNAAAEKESDKGTDDAKQALSDVLEADGTPDMTVARTDSAPANIASWEYRMMAGGFTVTAVMNDGSPSQRVAFGLDGTKMTGLGSKNIIADGSSKEDGAAAVQAFLTAANTDYLAAKNAIPETPDLSLSTDLTPQGLFSGQNCADKIANAPLERWIGDIGTVGGAILVGIWFFGTGGVGLALTAVAGGVLIVFGQGVNMDHADWSLYCRTVI